MTKGGVLIGVGVNSTGFRPSQNRPLFLFFYTVCCFQSPFCFGLGLARRDQSVMEHLMTGPEGNSEFCFPEALYASGNIEVEGNKNHCFPRHQSLVVLLYLLNLKLENLNAKKSLALHRLTHKFAAV